jgi:thioredoxin reductase (NADPH)
MAAKVYDTIILGGGPAGLSAAVYMGRFLRSTLVVDAGRGRAAGHQINENYLGFPKGIKVRRLRELGRQQAARFGVEFCDCSVIAITKGDTCFMVECSGDMSFQGKQLIVATGVSDIWPAFPYVERYIGKSLFWCITCDGYKMQDRDVLLLGNTDEAAITALQFLRFTNKLTMLAHPDYTTICPERLDDLKRNNIRLIEAEITRVKGAAGSIDAVQLSNGEVLQPDVLFSLYGKIPNSQLVAGLGVMLNAEGYIEIDENQQTNVAGVFAAGDVTGAHAHQIACAVHEGAMAASAANYALYPPLQRHDTAEQGPIKREGKVKSRREKGQGIKDKG